MDVDAQKRRLKYPWARITYTDAIHELQKSGAQFDFEPQWGSPLQSEHERWLADSFARGPIFVTDYPAATKPFYMYAKMMMATADCCVL